MESKWGVLPGNVLGKRRSSCGNTRRRPAGIHTTRSGCSDGLSCIRGVPGREKPETEVLPGDLRLCFLMEKETQGSMPVVSGEERELHRMQRTSCTMGSHRDVQGVRLPWGRLLSRSSRGSPSSDGSSNSRAAGRSAEGPQTAGVR